MDPSGLAEDNLREHLSLIGARLAEREDTIRSLLPEADRLRRLENQLVALFKRYPDENQRPPLCGMVVGVKDIFHVAGFTTQAGSRLPPEVLQGQEAGCVSRLKQAGALILGKTVTTEFAYFSPGPTRNPHHPEHTPGGSSSGSAAAVSAGFCDLALGTQTIGSIIRPAAFCGVVGFKPSYDRIPRDGVIPLAPSLDHVGFLTANVSFARSVASILIDDWKEGSSVQKPILGVPRGSYLGCTSLMGRSYFDGACKLLTSIGYEIREVEAMANYNEIRNHHDRIMAVEAAQVHAVWFGKYANLYAPKTAELIRRGQAYEREGYLKALSEQGKLRSELMRSMDENHIDLWIAPSAPGPAPKGLDSTGDPVMNLPWTQAGLPALNLPAGKSKEGLPVGLQVVGRWYEDETLLAWAGGMEKDLAVL